VVFVVCASAPVLNTIANARVHAQARPEMAIIARSIEELEVSVLPAFVLLNCLARIKTGVGIRLIFDSTQSVG
jgi:hypothetical protein